MTKKQLNFPMNGLMAVSHVYIGMDMLGKEQAARAYQRKKR